MTCEAGHTALNIGLRDEVERHLSCEEKTIGMNKAAAINSIPPGSHEWDEKPLPGLIPSCHHGNVCRFVADAVENTTPLPVHLFGGLGDHLEMLSLVLPWGSAARSLEVDGREKQYHLLAPLLPEHASIEPFDRTCSPFAGSWPSDLGA